MMFFTHLALGVLLGVIYLHNGQSMTSQGLIFITILIGSILPDIDRGTSYLGRHLKPLNDFFHHRKFFHSIIFMMLVAISLAFLLHNPDYAVAFILGFSSHLFLDSMTPGGLYAFWPARIAIRGKFKTGSVFDMTLFAVFSILAVYALFVYNIDLIATVF